MLSFRSVKETPDRVVFLWLSAPVKKPIKFRRHHKDKTRTVQHDGRCVDMGGKIQCVIVEELRQEVLIWKSRARLKTRRLPQKASTT